MGVNEADIAAIVNSSNPWSAFVAWTVKMGMIPTKAADVLAILMGGTAYYLNQYDFYIKEGYSHAEADAFALRDFEKATQTNQQSGEQHMVSNLQASDLGKILFAFKNTPMQYARIIKKSIQKIAKGHGDTKVEIGKIMYYGAIQSFMFTALQMALFAALDDEDEDWDKKTDSVINGMIDNLLNGTGFGGLVTVTMKNGIIEYKMQEEKGWNADHTYTILEFANMSPPIGSKLRKIYGAIQTKKYNQEAIDAMDWYDPDNPEWAVAANLIEAFTNIPTSRLYNKQINIRTALNGIISDAWRNHNGTEEDFELEFWERFALLLGWNTWDLGIKTEAKKIQEEIKENNKKIKKKNKQNSKDEDREEEHQKTVVVDQKKEAEKRKEEGKPKQEVHCSNFKNGKQCQVPVENPGDFCHYHDPDKSKNYTCGAKKTSGGTCKNQTNNYDDNGNKTGCFLHNEVKMEGTRY